MPEKDEKESSPKPSNRKVQEKQVTVRMIGKQSIAEDGAVYHPERKHGGRVTPADTFKTTPNRAEALADHVVVVEEPKGDE